jgi:cytochrome oxidase Cu insertion factor (SCO1/SenC/PrrC family)
MTTRVLLFLGLVLVALAVAWVLVPPAQAGRLSRGTPAPEFAATALDGRSFRLGDLRGKVVVLDFWAT